MLRLAALLAVAGCAASPAVDRHRFKNQPAVTAVNDRADVPHKPKKREVPQLLYNWNAMVHDRIVRATELPARRRALGVNALDEVPDSTWFTDRLDGLTAEAIRAGPNNGAGPMARKPWTIVSSKAIGVAPGFVVEDSAGDRYILKFEELGFPEYETATHVVVHRLLWALGYNVPEDFIVSVNDDELKVGDGAVVKDLFGNERPMTRRDVIRILTRAHREGGAMRGLASKFVPGVPIGGTATTGTRSDDPNDRIPHQHRRDQRGLYPIFAWLKHTDVKPNNALDAWIEDVDRPGTHYVRHYLIDFGKAMGVLGWVSRTRTDGHARWLDFGEIAKAAISFGLQPRPWDQVDKAPYRGVGIFGVEGYDPGAFEVRIPYAPFIEGDRFDNFWGAKRLMRLTPEHIRAAVAEASYSDPRAARYVADTLIARQRITARYHFRRVNPLDGFELVDGRDGRVALCFDDLVRRYSLEPASILDGTGYLARAHGYDGTATGWVRRGVHRGRGRVCLADLRASPSPAGYTIVAVETARPGARLAPVLVHIARGPNGRLRVIGIRRR
jgi:hypothetical protein